MNKEATILFKCTYIVANFANLFDTHEMEERDDQFVDQAIDVHDMLVTVQATLTLFKKLTNFTLNLRNWCFFVVPIITMGDLSRRPSKLTLQQ